MDMSTVEIVLDDGAVIVAFSAHRDPNEFLEDVRLNIRQYLTKFYEETGFFVSDRKATEVRLA